MTRRAALKIAFQQFFSVDSPKAIKAAKYNYLNAINYMSPAKSGGLGNLCSHASLGCIEICLGLESGQAAMINKKTGTNKVRDSRKRKAQFFFRDMQGYMSEMMVHIARNHAKALRKGMTLAVRPNGSTDVQYEKIRIMVDSDFAAVLSRISGLHVEPGMHTIFSAFPSIQFLDYTKNHTRFWRDLPHNYDLTFSLSEKNQQHALNILADGKNVAIVFGGTMPTTWQGYPVISGDEHDLRFLDPKGVVVGLTPKGNKIKLSLSGFVVRDEANLALTRARVAALQAKLHKRAA